jgi:hypothetical protein
MKTLTRAIAATLVLLLFCSAVALADDPAESPESEDRPPVYETETLQGYFVRAPNGNLLWTKIIQPRPDLYPGETFPAVVSVPGGLGAGEAGNHYVADNGIIEFHFNAEGRGVLHPSEGTEDHNGFAHQDDLRALIEFALSRENVDIENVGVVTGSYGITMGAGCLGRYPGLPVKYLVDIEGPSESFVTCFEPWSLDEAPENDRIDQAYQMFGHWSTRRDTTAENIAWWSEREATRYIGSITSRYLRVQAEWDHAQPPNAAWPEFDYPPLWFLGKHAIDLVNLATLGDSPWTRVNGVPMGNPVNALYGYGNPPVYYPESLQSHPALTELMIREMALMPPLAGSDVDGEEPASARLVAVHPNPFERATTITYERRQASSVTLRVYGVDGRLVRTIVDATADPGVHQVTWDALDDRGVRVASGVYLLRLEADGSVGAPKVVLLR